MQTMPAGHDRTLRTYTTDSTALMAHSNTSNSDRGIESNNVTSF